MENKRNDSLPEFDSEYIDQLFSSGNPAVKKETPPPVLAEAPAEVEPKTEVSAKPAPTRSAALMILAVAGLLLLGFLAGSLFGREKQPSTVTTPPATTLAPQFGFIPGYETWSTDSLALMATELPILWDALVTLENFEALAKHFTVLKILVDRDDALYTLQELVQNDQTSETAREAAQWLITYINTYVPYLSPCRWLQYEDENFTVYEFTVEPRIHVEYTIYSHTQSKTVLQFNNHAFFVDGEPEILKEECNFWFLLRRNEGSRVELDTDNFQVISATGEAVSDIRVGFLPCEEGWIVCGHAPSGVSILLYQPSSTYNIALSVAHPLQEGLSTEELLRKTLALGAFQRYLAFEPAHFQYHPLMAALLEREDLISTALQVAKNDPQMHYTFLMTLLAHDSVQEQMTVSQKNAFDMLEADRYLKNYPSYASRPAIAISGNVAISDDFYLTADDARMIRDTNANCWFSVNLSAAARELNDGSWSLEVEETNYGWGIDSETNILLWPIYQDNGCQAQTGWLVAVQNMNGRQLRLTLRDGRDKILEAAEFYWMGDIMPVLPEG